jgi:hypothetical protein
MLTPAAAEPPGASANPQAAGECLTQAKSLPMTGNQIVDTRCSLVAFEVCMNRKTGYISQSQDARRQCAMIQTLAGASACQSTCLAASALPVGGSGRVDRYTGLTSEAVACYEARMASIGARGNDDEFNDCVANTALECLQNASSSPVVNAAIARERRSSCKSFHARYRQGRCGACFEDRPRVDYEAMKQTDILPGIPGK